MSDLDIRQFMEQLHAELAQLAARQGLVSEAIGALSRLYPGAIPAEAGPRTYRVTAICADGAERDVTPPVAPTRSLPTRVNNNKPRVREKNAKPATPPKPTTPSAPAAPPVTEMDALDQEIVTAIRRYGALTATEISLKVSKGVSSTHYRLQGLVESGQIRRGDDKRYSLATAH